MPKFYYKSPHKCFRVAGERSAKFLHGQFTNSIENLKNSEGNYNLLLDRKGGVRADLYVWRREGFCDLAIPEHFSGIVMDHLQKFAPLSRCGIQPLQNIFVYFVYRTPMGNVFQNFQKAEDKFYDVFLVVNEKYFLQQLSQENFTEFDEKTFEHWRIKNEIPTVGVDVTDKNLPQEGRLDHALNFEKGCYLGQEVIARLHYRGHVTKILTGFQSKEKGFRPGDEIQNEEGKKIGVVTSAVFDEAEKKSYFLGYVPFSQKEKGCEVWVRSFENRTTQICFVKLDTP